MKPTRRTHTLRRLRPLRLGLVIGALMLAVIAAGCGSSSPDSSVAAIDDTTASTTTASGTASEDVASDDPQQAALDWAACMRKNGVDVPDPEVDSDGRVRIGPGAGRGADDIDPETFEAAQKKCGSPFGNGGGPPISEADREEQQATMLEFAACMRKNGVDMPDPDFSGGGGAFRVGGPGSNRIDPDDPTFSKAREACESILQDIRPGGAGGSWGANQRVVLMRVSRRTVTVVGIASGVVIAAGLAVAVATGGTETAAATTSETASTVAVVQRDLVTRDDVSGTLGYADSVTISAGTAGVVTKLPAAGSVVVRGKALAEVNARAVRLLYGATPMWRRLEKGIDDGADVAQLERNLLELGYDPSGLEVDDHFDGATANAVKAWQDALGVAETGALEPGDIVFLVGARRIGQLSTSTGTSVQPGQALLTTTATTPVVDIDLAATDQELAKVGAKVSVELPSGQIVAGTITERGRVAETATDAQGQTGEATVSVTVTLGNPAKRDALDGAPVIVSLERSRAKSVLAVPVEALLALQGGGSALEQVAADGTRSLVAVETGRFADGFVEIEGKGVRKGQNVVVPS